MRRLVSILVCAALAVVACGVDDGDEVSAPVGPVEQIDRAVEASGWPMGFAPDDDVVEQVDCPDVVPDGHGVVCAYVTVPADYDDHDAAELELFLAVIPPSDDSVHPPAVYLEGGPGFGAVPEIEGWLADPLAELSEQRAIVLLDQRGTGYSLPVLDCKGVDDYDVADPQLITTCSAELAAAGTDLSWYSSRTSAADVAFVRVALGIDEWDLLGSSYGSRLALTVLRDDPTGVRAVAIDGIYPPAADGAGARGARESAVYAMDLFVGLCSADPACLDALGDPAEVLLEAIDVLDTALDEDPELTVGGVELLYGLSNLVVQPELSAILLDVANGDPDAIIDLEDLLDASLRPLRAMPDDDEAAEVSTLMRLALDCAEEEPFAEPAPPGSGGDWPDWVLELVDLGAFDSNCARWGIGAGDPVETEPVSSELPVLLISGELDAITPPVWAQLAARTLPSGQLVSVPHLGHDAVLDPCVVSIMVAFLDDPFAAVATGCLDELEPLRYEL